MSLIEKLSLHTEIPGQTLEPVTVPGTHPELQAHITYIDQSISQLATEIAALELKNRELMTTAFTVAQAALTTLLNQENVAEVWHQPSQGGMSITNQLTQVVTDATKALSQEAADFNKKLVQLQKKLAVLQTYRRELEATEQMLFAFIDQLGQIETLPPEKQLEVLNRLENLRVTLRFLTNTENTPFAAAYNVLKTENQPTLNELFITMLRPHLQAEFPSESVLFDELCRLYLLKILVRLGVPLKLIIRSYPLLRRDVSWIGVSAGEAVPPVFVTFVNSIADSISRSFNAKETGYVCSMVNPELRLHYAQLLNLPTDKQTV